MNKSPPILLIEDDEIMGESLCDRFILEGLHCDWHRQATSAREALLAHHGYRLVISDIRLPDLGGDMLFETLQRTALPLPPFLFITGHGEIDTAVRLLKAGARDYLTKPFDLDALVEKIRPWVSDGQAAEATLGISSPMRTIEAMLPRLAIHHATVLIAGESGVGKEQVAAALHRLRGSKQPFVAVNCGALTESLLEAELFGYEKGAFTGAQRQKRGVFEQADGGTLFLDEIGDMPLAMQVRLLRALQEKCITRIGGEAPVEVDFRLVCATHRDLKALVEEGDFRQDLYYRINVLCLRIPPLRERREDILWLARRLLDDICVRERCGRKTLSPAAEQALLDYPWPGNIRELKHALERACILCGEAVLCPEALFERPPRPPAPSDSALPADAVLANYLEACERDYIQRVLGANAGHIQNSANVLGISRKNLWEKMRKLNIGKD